LLVTRGRDLDEAEWSGVLVTRRTAAKEG
jgi:hypothetical protein